MTRATVRKGALARIIPVFPLAGVVLLPRGQLPLNVFEPRYLAMTRDAMAGARLIGMVQPRDAAREGELQPPLYETGCAGRITQCEETEDGRLEISLTGVCRFRIAEELPLAEAGYRQVRADFDPFTDDLRDPDDAAVDRARLVAALRRCLPDDAGGVDWPAIVRMGADSLVTSLAMVFPFAANEKQALLEATDCVERARILVALMEMSAAAESTAHGGSLQ